MALKSTIYKANLHLADMDRQVYGEHALTLALHPSETEERLMVRVLAFALQAPADDLQGGLMFARGLSDTDEPDLWQKDLTEQIVHWIEVGQPDERRMAKACGKAERVTIYCYGSSAHIWWAGLETKVTRLKNLEVWRLPADQAQALGERAQRSMQLQVQVQDGHVYFIDDAGSLELQPEPLWRGGR
jgi:uncharacterized protein YaeQ